MAGDSSIPSGALPGPNIREKEAMHDWEKRLGAALGDFEAGNEKYNLTPLLALASEAGRQATYWQARAQQLEARLEDWKGFLGRAEGGKGGDEAARIGDLQACIRQQEGHIEDLNALVDRLLEALPRIVEALAIMRNPHDGTGEGQEGTERSSKTTKEQPIEVKET